MFSFFNKKTHTPPSTQFALPGPWVLSENDQLLEEIGEYTSNKLETMCADFEASKSICKNGDALSISQLSKRLHETKLNMPVENTEDSITDWLIEAYSPEDIADGDEEERIFLEVEAWVEAHRQPYQISKTG